MLVYGGDVFGQKDYLTTKDPFLQGLGIFDMTELAWDADGKYNADAEDYRTPKIVEDWYRSHNLSDISWSSNEMRDTFLANTIDFDKPTSTSTSSSTATASATFASTNKESPTSNVGAIAGGVAGGVVALALIAGLAYYFRFKRRSKKPPSPGEVQPLETGEPKAAAEDIGKPKAKEELPTESQATELYVPPKELANNHEVWELDAAGRIGELDTSSPACELQATNPVVHREN